MTSSSKSRPEITRYGESNVLIGTGERTVKLGIASIHIYSMALYVDAEGCRACLSEFAGADHDALLRHPHFYASLVRSKFKKIFRLHFHRALSRKRAIGGFADAIASRCDDENKEHASAFLERFCGEGGVSAGDVLTLVCEADGATVRALLAPAGEAGGGGEASESELLAIESGGGNGLWSALQNVYLDERTALPTIRHGAVALLPDLLTPIRPDGNDGPSSPKTEDEAIDEQFVGTSWSEFAGRTDGPSGYKFGDFTRGVTRSVFSTACAAGSYTYQASVGRAFQPSPDAESKSGETVPEIEDDKYIIAKQLEAIKTLEADVRTFRDDVLRKEGEFNQLVMRLILIVMADFAISMLAWLAAPSLGEVTGTAMFCWLLLKAACCLGLVTAKERKVLFQFFESMLRKQKLE